MMMMWLFKWKRVGIGLAAALLHMSIATFVASEPSRPMHFKVQSVNGVSAAGKDALSEAILVELAHRGYHDAQASGSPHALDVWVEIGAPDEGRVPVALFWIVWGPDGKRIATVPQNNRLPLGMDVWAEIIARGVPAGARGIVKAVRR